MAIQPQVWPAFTVDHRGLGTTARTPASADLLRWEGNALSMQDFNRYVFRRNHSSQPGIPVRPVHELAFPESFETP